MPAIPKNTQQDFSIELRDIFGTLDTATTGAPTVNLCKDGTWAVATNAATNTKAGYWKVTLTAAETNFREVIVEAVKTGFVTFSRTFYPEPDYTPTKATYITGDAYVRLGAPAGASVSADVASVKTDTGTTIPGRLPAALVGGRMDSSVGAVATGVIAAASFAANALDAVWSTTTRTLSAAGVQAIWDAATSALTTVGSIGKWLVDKIDVVLSTRLASSSYTAPLDAAGTRSAVGLAFPDLDTKFTDLNTDVQQIDLQVDNVYADTQSLLGRIGAFTGTGVNTVLGFFKALLSKTATLPSDVGGTFDPTTDSTEAIRDRGDAAWTGGGGGGNDLDELLADHTIAGSAGQAISDILAATATLGAATVEVQSPVATDGDVSLYYGASYTVASGSPVSWSSDSWQDLTGATIDVVRLDAASTSFGWAVDVLTPGAGTQTVRAQITAAQVKALGLGNSDIKHPFRVVARLANGQDEVLVDGTLSIL